MKSFSRILAGIALLPVTGCIFPDHRDFSDEAAASSTTFNGRNKSVRTVERRRTFKPRLGEIGMKG